MAITEEGDIIEGLKKELSKTKAENFKLKGELGNVRSGSGRVQKFLRGELRELRAKLAEIEYLDGEAQQGAGEITRQLVEAQAECARLRDLLGTTAEQWETLANNFKTGWARDCEMRHDVILLVERIAKEQLARLRAALEAKP